MFALCLRSFEIEVVSRILSRIMRNSSRIFWRERASGFRADAGLKPVASTLFTSALKRRPPEEKCRERTFFDD